MSAEAKQELTAFWTGGVDSANDPAFIGPNNVAWAFNAMHRGGKYRTRPGFSEVIADPVGGGDIQTDNLSPQGMCMFRPFGDTWHKVMAHGGKIYYSRFPFESWTQLPGIQFYPYADFVIFEVAIKSKRTNTDGSVTFVSQPYPVLIMQDGFTRAAYWDGLRALHIAEIPIGQTMKWNSQRLWVASEHRLYAGDEGDPLSFAENEIVATGGFFVLPDIITCISETPDLQALLVHTADTTSAFQSAILDRNQWRATAGFQKLLFRNIGCVGPLASVMQYGVVAWMSHNGAVFLDTALQTYRTRRIRYADSGVARSKAKLSRNLYRVCAGQFENFVFFSWPSSDLYNAHTIVMDQTSFEASAGEEAGPGGQSSWAGVWKGIRPVQWVTAVVDGRNRCFALSRDYAATGGSDYVIGLWEAFCRQRADITLDGTIKRIAVGVETRQLGYSAQPKKLEWIEIGMSELRDQIDVLLSYAGRRSGYRQVGSKTIQATQRSPDMEVIDSFAPQQRVIRSRTIKSADPARQTSQSPYNQAVDLGFGVYVQWTGDGALDAARISFVEQPKAGVGKDEENEEDSRLVDWLNNETILPDAPPASVIVPTTSPFIDNATPKFAEPFYNARS